MCIRYFSHDSNARSDVKILQVRKKYGAEGYGIYFMLLEAADLESDASLEADFEALAWDLRVDAEKLRSVVCDFGLFEFESDGKRFYAPSMRRRRNEIAAKTLQKSEARREAGRKSAQKRKERKEASKIDDTPGKQKLISPQVVVDVGDNVEYLTPETFCEAGVEEEKRIEETRADWNATFVGTKNQVRAPVGPTTLVGVRLRESLDAYSREEISDAFKEAKKADFPWTFDAAVKKSNIQLLLVKQEKEARLGDNLRTSSGKLRASPIIEETGENWNALFETDDPYKQ